MSEITKKLRDLKTRDKAGLREIARNLLRRMLSHSELVSLQATKEFRSLLMSERDHIQSWTAGDTFDPIVGEILCGLLNIAIRSSGQYQEEVRGLALECIGIFGAVDADRVDFPQDPPPIILHKNFEDRDERADFACHLMSSALVPSYRLLNDPKHQNFVAYAIQQLSKLCEFTTSLVDAVQNGRTAQNRKAADRFFALSKDAQETVSSLLSSQYADPPVHYPKHICPIYKARMSYQEWLQTWTISLLSRVTVKNAKVVFEPFLQVVKNQDVAIAHRLLPHLVQHVLISGTNEDRDDISSEIKAVLADQLVQGDHSHLHTKLQSAELVFDLMDHLSLYVRRQREEQQRQGKKSRKSKAFETSETIPIILSIIEQVPLDMMARAAFQCKAYARSLMSFEMKISELPKAAFSEPEVQQHLENLHEIYAELDEPDGMEGISTLILSPSLQHQIRQHEATGRWTSAQSCWEVQLQSTPNDLNCQLGLLRCLRNLGHYDTLQTHIRAVLQDHPEFSRALVPYTIETHLFSGDWKQLDDLPDDLDCNIPEVVFAYTIKALRAMGSEMASIMQEARALLAAPILAAGTNAYRRVYDAVTQLHLLHELELIIDLRRNESASIGREGSFGVHPLLAKRLDSAATSFRTRESILRLRRTAFNLKTSDLSATSDWSAKQISNLWISSAKIARKAGHTQTAYTAILQAERGKAPFVFFEKAKFMRQNNELSQAIQIMNVALDDSNASKPAFSNKSLLARCLLRRARWMDEAERYGDNKIVLFMKQARQVDQEWESTWFYLGKFYDDVRNRGTMLNKYDASWQVIKAFSSALRQGTKFIYQTLPKIVTMWMSYADDPALVKLSRDKTKTAKDYAQNGPAGIYFLKINKVMADNVDLVATYQWLTVFPQLVSRLLHKNVELYQILEKLLVKVFLLFPHQAFWGLASALKSTTVKRAQRCDNLFQKTSASCAATKDDPRSRPIYGVSLASNIILEGRSMVDGLLHLCDYDVSRIGSKLSMAKHFSKLNKCAPSSLMIPLQNLLTVTLPAGAGASEHKPFPLQLVTFQRFDDQVDVMSSLQKPRRITVVGSDGNSYAFLCKPKDDLRKDARLMEFNSMINKLLKKDAESRKRRLYIRTYSVVTLNEECGLIEWVGNTVVCRSVLTGIYSAKNIPTWAILLCDRYPPIFRLWFYETFPEPTSWLRARMAYARTAAVISMIGFVLGLGDRHCENILFDSTTGDTIHVDFNCLFDKGKAFEISERVPFRLTQNIVDGLGVTGVEGTCFYYSPACQVTMQLLRVNIDSLMSVLETFVHDPLVEWTETDRRIDPRAQEALKVLQEVEQKLSGLRATFNSPSTGRVVTAENQVESLIREAMDDGNLVSLIASRVPAYDLC
ncbi:hypothetical protein BT69DRAFT_1266476 [Atractiella rhizophila]|nr:hypothetical protein BT69DRAFT_1266476 [Atractiella rhizophila]